ncbi:galactose mutarotase-like isoform X2 [Anthonomus grandis grandis]|uniref:galactose mutarotase-like isoform X2 n=1 Tax=Anthonomus grandis grandis TaxID=2921223 RepID=UPI002165E892|nr:galactose mutarotase-like isoform X2 [Anthonomus grandis grandis]
MMSESAPIQATRYYQNHEVEFEEDEFDTYKDKESGHTISVRRFTWRNTSGVSVQVITYGATITSIKMPDKNGTVDDIVMGFDDMKGYQNPLNPYFGATVGRVANRIGNAQIDIDGRIYKVTANLGEHTLHGGIKGFDKVNWSAYVDGSKLSLSYLSKDLEEGFPGDVLTTVTYELTNDNRFLYEFKSTSTKPTFVNLTNHSYFNLAGHQTGPKEVYKHVISINADSTTEVDRNSIPSGKLLPVADTIFDLRIPKVLGEVINRIPGYLGYDHNFCVTKGSAQENTFVARAVHPPTGRVLEIYSNQPGVQFYTSNHIPEDPRDFQGDKSKLKSLRGKGGAPYYKHGSFCFETQNYPDAVNHKNFPAAVLYPGKLYQHTVEYRLIIKK